MWVPYNPNPYGRYTGDCVIRAIACATNSSWKDVKLALSMKASSLGDMDNSTYVWGNVMIDLGWHPRLVLDSCINCHTVRDFARKFPYGIYILMSDSHAVCVRNGDYYDTWDSGDIHPIIYFEEG